MVEIEPPTSRSDRHGDERAATGLPGPMPRPERLTAAAGLEDALLPAGLFLLTVLLGFSAGGYFADEIGWAAAAVAVALGVSALALGRPPAGMSRSLGVAAGALGLFALWTYASGIWSDAPGRVLVEFDRVLLYLGVLLLFGAAPRPRAALRHLPVAFAAAATVLCGAALWVRLLPESWPWALPPPNTRMDWPLTYENALGALAALGLVLALHCAAWPRRGRVVRLAAAGALPILAAALVLTFSRGGTLAAGIGLLALLVLGLSRSLVATLAAVALPVVAAVQAAYDADLLGTRALRSPAGIAQGHDVAVALALAVALAVAAMAIVLALEPRLLRQNLPRIPSRSRSWIALVAVGTLLGITAAFAASGAAERLYDRVVQGGTGTPGASERSRLTDLRTQSRPSYWRVAVDAFERDPVVGSGAGDFVIDWSRDRPVLEDSAEGHSVYLETLAELGIVGGVLLAVALGTIVWSLAAGIGGSDRRVHAALTAAAVAWLAHAGLDWDWEMPVLTLWLVAAGGCALAARGPAAARRRPGWPARSVAAGACALAALTPAAVALSQDRLDESASALSRGDCETAARTARESVDVVGVRAEGYAVQAYCAGRDGRADSSIRLMRQAIDRDPHNWKYHYGLAVLQAADGRDPRPAIRAALAANPREELTRDGLERFGGPDPATWRRNALTAPLPRP